MNSRRVVWPARLRAPGSSAAIDSHKSRSAADPKSSSAARNSRATAANRSAGQRFAPPYAAPGLIPIDGPCDTQPGQVRKPLAARAASMPSSRIASHGGKALHQSGAAQQFEIVKALVARNFARFGHGNRVGQEQARGRRGCIRCGPGCRPATRRARRRRRSAGESRHRSARRAGGRRFRGGSAGIRDHASIAVSRA